jgi:Glycosyltransferase family 87
LPNELKKITEYLLLSFFIGLFILKGVVPALHSVHSDFANYYVSASLIADGISLENIYDNEWFQNKIYSYGIHTPGKFSPFPPLTAWMMLPLTPFESLTAQRIFTIINLLFVVIGTITLRNITQLKWIHCVLLLLGSGLAIINNLAFGQIYLIMMSLMLVAILLVKNKFHFTAGFILGVLTALKYFPIVIIGSFFMIGISEQKKNDWRLSGFLKNSNLQVALYSLATLLALWFAQYLYFGSKVMDDFLHSALIPHLDGVLSGQGLYSFQFQSWDNFARNLFVYHKEFNSNPVLDWPQGRTIFKIGITLFVSSLLFMNLYRYRLAPLTERWLVYISLPMLAALVLLPASATYHFVLLVPPIALLVSSSLFTRRTIYFVLALYGLIGLIPYSLAFTLGHTWGVFFAYPRLWLMTILFLLISLKLPKPNRLVQS